MLGWYVYCERRPEDVVDGKSALLPESMVGSKIDLKRRGGPVIAQKRDCAKIFTHRLRCAVAEPLT
jgi:hypothetical protein